MTSKKWDKLRPNPLQTIQHLLRERYQQAKTTFWSGSVSINQGTSTSDLDLVVLYEKLPNAYRDAFIYQEWPLDVFVHDQGTLIYFFEKVDKPSHTATLPRMVLDGIEIPAKTDFGDHLKQIAKSLIDQGPLLSENDLDYKRFLISDLIDDLKGSTNPHQFMVICHRLHDALCTFYLLANNQWAAEGKTLIRALRAYDPKLTDRIFKAFQGAYQTNKSGGVEEIVQHILEPHGGLLWDGFHADAPKEWRTN